MQIKEVIEYLETIAPKHLQESYDNAGLIIGQETAEITGILFCLDSTEQIVQEAISKGCNLIIAHHPIIFRGLKSLQGKNYIERTVIDAIKNNIAIYAIHTNLDNVLRHGVNEKIASTLDLVDLKILAPKTQDDLQIGSGIIGRLPRTMTEVTFLEALQNKMQTRCIRHTALLNRPVQKIAICGGSGSFLLSKAIQEGADVFVSADFKYHEFFDADGQIMIADIGHYESEQYTINLLFELVTNKFTNFAAYCTEWVTNPIKYYC